MKALQLEHPIDEHLKPIKDSDSSLTSMEVSTTKLRVKDLEVTGTVIGINEESTTVDSSLTDGSTNPVENNAVFDGLALKLDKTGGALTGDITITDTTAPQLALRYDSSNYCLFSLDSNGATTIRAIDESTGTDGDIILDADGDIVFNSANGVFIAKNAGTEFSVANSSYAGMILGYTTVGIGQAPASFDVTDAMLPVHDDLKVTFKAPPSGVVEIMVSIYVDTDSPRPLTFGLSTTDASTGFTTLHAQYENHTFYGDETDGQQHQHRWVITGINPNAVVTYWLAAGATQIGRIDLRWGGDSSAVADGSEPYEYQPFIMKATALPTAIADYAVYG